ncbi:MAG TPA: hypothetical protein VHU83_17060 [Bryobacteraceae bacterium]|nr:hypothetical protein [Bryobacteraceae bacterium]
MNKDSLRMGIDIYSHGAGVFIMYEFIHIVKENVLYVARLVSLWERCGVEPGRDEGAAV